MKWMRGLWRWGASEGLSREQGRAKHWGRGNCPYESLAALEDVNRFSGWSRGSGEELQSGEGTGSVGKNMARRSDCFPSGLGAIRQIKKSCKMI